jgi:hypothetical protein
MVCAGHPSLTLFATILKYPDSLSIPICCVRATMAPFVEARSASDGINCLPRLRFGLGSIPPASSMIIGPGVVVRIEHVGPNEFLRHLHDTSGLCIPLDLGSEPRARTPYGFYPPVIGR